MKWIKDFYNFCSMLAQKPWALPFLGLFSFLESIIVPLPADPLLMAVCAARPKASVKAFFWTLGGSLLGAFIGYSLGLYFSSVMKEFLLEYFLTADQFIYLTEAFAKGTFVFVFMGGFTPLPFKVFAITTGLLNGALIPFLLGALVGRGLRFGIIALLFYFYGKEIKVWIDSHFEKVVWVLSALIFILVLIYFVALR